MIDDVLELLAIELEPIELVVVFERLCGTARDIVALAAAVIGKNSICESNFLERFIRGLLLVLRRLI